VGFGGVLVEGEDELSELVSDEGHVCEVHGGADADDEHAVDELEGKGENTKGRGSGKS
jgi:hypothetical protein